MRHESLTQGQVETPSFLAEFMARLALSHHRSTPSYLQVLDPAVGRGALLAPLVRLAQDINLNLVGIDIDPILLEVAYWHLTNLMDSSESSLTLLQGDFLRISPSHPHLQDFDIILMNPPYVRGRDVPNIDELLVKITPAGLPLGRATNLYILFILHALRFLRPGGLLVCLVPSTLYTIQAFAPIRRYLATHYQIRLMAHIPLTGPQQVFRSALVSAAVIAIENSPPTSASIPVIRVQHPEDLLSPLSVETLQHASCAGQWSRTTCKGLTEDLWWGRRFLPPLVPKGVPLVPLSRVFHVTSGIRSGYDPFFTLTQEDVVEWGIPPECLSPLIPSASAVRGHRFTSRDHAYLVAQGRRAFLLTVPYRVSTVQRYLEHGIRLGVHRKSIPSHRHLWFRIDPTVPPLIMKAMYRGPPMMTLNDSPCTTLSTFLWFTPRVRVPHIPETDLLRALLVFTSTDMGARAWNQLAIDMGKGLHKVEVSAARQVMIPDFTSLQPVVTCTISRLADNLFKSHGPLHEAASHELSLEVREILCHQTSATASRPLCDEEVVEAAI